MSNTSSLQGLNNSLFYILTFFLIPGIRIFSPQWLNCLLLDWLLKSCGWSKEKKRLHLPLLLHILAMKEIMIYMRTTKNHFYHLRKFSILLFIALHPFSFFIFFSFKVVSIKWIVLKINPYAWWSRFNTRLINLTLIWRLG